jgi:hypothetical protein
MSGILAVTSQAVAEKDRADDKGLQEEISPEIPYNNIKLSMNVISKTSYEARTTTNGKYEHRKRS